MNILITGVAGFIGFSSAAFLLNKKVRVFGIDNLDNYYSVKLKKKRLQILKKNKFFKFKKIDILNYKKLISFFKKNKIHTIIHLAAQAGVRYSLVDPDKYLNVNIVGFANIIKASSKFKVKKIIYASSSSVYGESKKFPLKESHILNPKNIYGMSKKINEEIADSYRSKNKIDFIGLRFFTVYGEWGRPDMFLWRLFRAHKLKKIFYLNNFGNHDRDFTYIGDVVKILHRLIYKKFNKHEIFNICSNKMINIMKVIKIFKKNNNLKVKLTKMHKADILKTLGSNEKIKKVLNIKKFSIFEERFSEVFKWFLKNKAYKY
jgi:UDP-glucuronate 4-epimerase